MNIRLMMMDKIKGNPYAVMMISRPMFLQVSKCRFYNSKVNNKKSKYYNNNNKQKNLLTSFKFSRNREKLITIFSMKTFLKKYKNLKNKSKNTSKILKKRKDNI